MTKARKTKRAETAPVEKLPEPLRSMAEHVEKDVADAGGPADGDGADEKAAEQMKEYVASRSPAAHPPASKP